MTAAIKSTFTEKNIPFELKQYRQWVLWRYETVDGRITKIPYQINGSKADSTNPKTWTSFDAVTALHSKGNYDGIGFVVTDEDDLLGVDLDHCRNALTGEINRPELDIINLLDSYTEITPSTEGVRVWLRGKKPSGGNRKGHIEIYDANRYFTVTGNHLEGTKTTIEARQDELNRLHASIFSTETTGYKGNGHKPQVDLAGTELVNKAMNAHNGYKFRQLWSGDTSGHGGDDSAADLALCSMLAFWTGNSEIQIDSLFRQSGLMREKWERQDYRERTIKAAVSGNHETYNPETHRKTNQDLQSAELPQIVVNGRPLRDVTTEAIAAMQAANNPPRIFERGANPVRTNRNEQNRPFIELMSEAAMRGFMDRSADYMNVREDSEGNLVYSHVHPPQDVVKDVLTVPQRRFPPLVAITPNPVIRANGTILSKPGYDAESKLYYEPEPGLKVPEIPENPTKEQLQAAINLFIEPLCDFPFENDASEANALAVLMCPVIRPMIDGCVPLALFDKPQSGTGASLLAEVIALVATGTPAAMMAAPGDNEEWRKIITTTILSGDTILIIDNIEDTLQSAALSVLLTSRQWKGRILGRSEDILLPNILTPIGTGNNVRLGGDLPRRCVWVRMDAQTARPWMRNVVFKHPNLHEWIMQSRGAILAAILTIVRSWILAGSPQKADQDILGGYESYSRILGGILEFIGVKGFLTNLASMYDIVDTNIPAWEAFLTAWYGVLKDREITTAELITELQNPDLKEFKAALPDDYADMTVKNYQRRLGIAISSRKMARFPNGLKIQKAGEAHHNAKWQVVDTNDNEGKATTPPAPTQPKMSLDNFTITQDSPQNRHEGSISESSSNQTYEKNNNTVNIIYGLGAVQNSQDSPPESKTGESCLKKPTRLEKIGKCPFCGKEDTEGMWTDDSPEGYYLYCTNCFENIPNF